MQDEPKSPASDLTPCRARGNGSGESGATRVKTGRRLRSRSLRLPRTSHAPQSHLPAEWPRSTIMCPTGSGQTSRGGVTLSPDEPMRQTRCALRDVPGTKDAHRDSGLQVRGGTQLCRIALRRSKSSRRMLRRSFTNSPTICCRTLCRMMRVLRWCTAKPSSIRIAAAWIENLSTRRSNVASPEKTRSSA